MYEYVYEYGKTIRTESPLLVHVLLHSDLLTHVRRARYRRWGMENDNPRMGNPAHGCGMFMIWDTEWGGIAVYLKKSGLKIFQSQSVGRLCHPWLNSFS